MQFSVVSQSYGISVSFIECTYAKALPKSEVFSKTTYRSSSHPPGLSTPFSLSSPRTYCTSYYLPADPPSSSSSSLLSSLFIPPFTTIKHALIPLNHAHAARTAKAHSLFLSLSIHPPESLIRIAMQSRIDRSTSTNLL